MLDLFPPAPELAATPGDASGATYAACPKGARTPGVPGWQPAEMRIAMGESEEKKLDFNHFVAQSGCIGNGSLGKETPMKDLLVAIATTGIAGLGGALAVYGSYDDSPGGTLLGIVVVLGAMALSARMARRTPST